MSATNRGSIRVESDFYATPENVIENILNNFDISKYGKNVLEPSAGNGNIIKVVRNMFPEKTITAIELRERERENLSIYSDKVIIGDFLNLEINQKYDVIIGNPPYSLALEFVQKSLDMLNENGCLIFLLRTAFLESKKRFDFWQENELSGLYTLSKRPSFTGKGTDATSYSWFIWDKSNDSQHIKII